MATKAELEAQIERLAEQNRQLTDALLEALKAKPYMPLPYTPTVWPTYPTITTPGTWPGGTITVTNGTSGYLQIVRPDDEEGPDGPDGLVGAKIA